MSFPQKNAAGRASFPARALLGFIWVYRHSFSAIMGKQCRFEPTCSVYTADSIRRFGALKGGALGILRLARCHPWGASGHDPVPEVFPARLISSKWPGIKARGTKTNFWVKFLSKKHCSCDRTLGNVPDNAIRGLSAPQEQKEPSRA